MTTFIISAILILVYPLSISTKPLETTTRVAISDDEGFDNTIIDFDEEYMVTFNKKYGQVPWHSNDKNNKNTLRYTILSDDEKNNKTNVRYDPNTNINISSEEESTTEDYKVIPLELISTTENPLVSIIESTTEPDLTVIPLSTTTKLSSITISQETVTLPATVEYDTTTEILKTSTDNAYITTSTITDSFENFTTTWEPIHLRINNQNTTYISTTEANNIEKNVNENIERTTELYEEENFNISTLVQDGNETGPDNKEDDVDVPIFTELDTEDFENIPEDYYDSKDVLPTSAPKTDAISVLFGLAGSVVESVAERVVPKTIYDLFKRMQRQNEALEAERLRSREENGGLGQLGRGILKSLSTGLGKPLSQLMAGVSEAGSLDTDRGFVGNVAASVSSVANAANTYLEAFKQKVQAIYPGTVWCGDGRSAQARSSSDLGLFFFTDTCCRQHDACKIYIMAGETKYGLTNTGLFTRSHCSCDAKFRECLRRTNSLVSAQIGLTYFNVLGPQCFRRAHPIIKCNRRTRITGMKCEEYDLDFTKPKMWQWFDNETF